MNFARSIVCALLVSSFAATASAQITITEPPDISTAFPGPIYTLGIGTNTVSGSVATPGDSQDNFQVTVPAGASLTAVTLTLNTGGGFNGFVTFNLSETRMSSGAFTMGFPYGPGTYFVQVAANFAIGNAWSLSFTVTGAAPVCGNGIREGAEACDDGNLTQCDGCSSTCTVALNGCFIGGVCIAEGTADPGNQCRACRRTISRTMYSPVAAGTSCNDGQFCTDVDTCNATGTCTGTIRTCSDGLTCTADACDEGANVCVNPVTSGCLIGGACIAEGAVSPTNACTACRAAASTSAYSPRPTGTSCDDGLFCTAVDTCNATGTCGGTTRDCSDALSCTTDSCDETADACTNTLSGGCLIDGACIAEGAVSPTNACTACAAAVSSSAYSPRPAGTSCDDGQFCTTADACTTTGTCGGTARDCSDPLSCTTDTCDETADACTNTLSGGCLIGGACVADGDVDPTNDCAACDPAASTSAYSPEAAGTTCDDGAFCTIDDVCDGSGTCGGAARVCADTDACTTDACSEASSMCTFDPIAGCAADAGTGGDAGTDPDGGTGLDAGPGGDAGAGGDAGPGTTDGGRRDGGATDGGGSTIDGGGAPIDVVGGCGCRATRTAPSAGVICSAGLALALAARRRRSR